MAGSMRARRSRPTHRAPRKPRIVRRRAAAAAECRAAPASPRARVISPWRRDRRSTKFLQDGHIGMIEQSACTLVRRVEHRTRKPAFRHQMKAGALSGSAIGKHDRRRSWCGRAMRDSARTQSPVKRPGNKPTLTYSTPVRAMPSTAATTTVRLHRQIAADRADRPPARTAATVARTISGGAPATRRSPRPSSR